MEQLSSYIQNLLKDTIHFHAVQPGPELWKKHPPVWSGGCVKHLSGKQKSLNTSII